MIEATNQFYGVIQWNPGEEIKTMLGYLREQHIPPPPRNKTNGQNPCYITGTEYLNVCVHMDKE